MQHQDDFTNSTSSIHQYSATPYFAMADPPLHPHPYGPSQPSSQVGQGEPQRTPPQGPAPGQAQALHAVTVRSNLAEQVRLAASPLFEQISSLRRVYETQGDASGRLLFSLVARKLCTVSD
jgi:hypothetical protein